MAKIMQKSQRMLSNQFLLLAILGALWVYSESFGSVHAMSIKNKVKFTPLDDPSTRNLFSTAKDADLSSNVAMSEPKVVDPSSQAEISSSSESNMTSEG